MSKKSDSIALYNTLINIGLTEAPLTWNRYAAFLVLEGFVLAGVFSFIEPNPAISLPVLTVTATIGLIVTGIWHVLNMLGWLNQNVFYYYASMIKLKKVKLPTDKYNYPKNNKTLEETLKPNSRIYKSAQSIPCLLMLVYSFLIVYGLSEFKIEAWYWYMIFILLVVVVYFLLSRMERNFIKSRAIKVGS